VVQVQPQALVLEIDGDQVGATPAYDGEQARDEALGRLRGALDQLAAQE
jgi:tryptophanyl-tRNA synthetase